MAFHLFIDHKFSLEHFAHCPRFRRDLQSILYGDGSELNEVGLVFRLLTFFLLRFRQVDCNALSAPLSPILGLCLDFVQFFACEARYFGNRFIR